MLPDVSTFYLDNLETGEKTIPWVSPDVKGRVLKKSGIKNVLEKMTGEFMWRMGLVHIEIQDLVIGLLGI